MLPDWIFPLVTRYKKVDKSTISNPQSERSMEEAHYQKQVDISDFGATFLACLQSDPIWTDGASAKNSIFSYPLSNSFAPVYSVGIESIDAQEPEQTQLKVSEMYVMKDTLIEWNDEYNQLDLEKKIEEYNSIAKGMEISLQEDGINFGGDIRVNLDFREHINVVDKVVPPTRQDLVNTVETTAKSTPTIRIRGFNVPQNTTEVIEIDSKTTARQTIIRLFKKLRMVNNPKGYALYEYEQCIDEAAGTLEKKLTRIADHACPLKVILNWPIPHSGRALVLQENIALDFLCGVSGSLMRDIFMKVTGLEEKQVDVRIKTNFRTGLFDTTYSKRESSIPKNGGYWILDILLHILFLIVSFTLITLVLFDEMSRRFG